MLLCHMQGSGRRLTACNYSKRSWFDTNLIWLLAKCMSFLTVPNVLMAVKYDIPLRPFGHISHNWTCHIIALRQRISQNNPIRSSDNLNRPVIIRILICIRSASNSLRVDLWHWMRLRRHLSHWSDLWVRVGCGDLGADERILRQLLPWFEGISALCCLSDLEVSVRYPYSRTATDMQQRARMDDARQNSAR